MWSAGVSGFPLGKSYPLILRFEVSKIMPSWWGKSSSKEAKKKVSKESILDTLQRKFKIPSENKSANKSSGGSRRASDTISERGCLSRAESRSSSPSKNVSRCQSFVDRPQGQPLPLPVRHPARVTRTESGINVSAKPKQEKVSKSSLFLPLPQPACIRNRTDPADLDGDLADSVFSECSIDSDDPADSSQRSPLASDYETGSRTTAGSPSWWACILSIQNTEAHD